MTSGPSPAYPQTRMRRLRRTEWSRRLVAESVLTPADLIWPIFLVDGANKREPIAAMPGVDRLSVDLVPAAVEEAQRLGIPVIALFPYTDPARKTDDGVDGGVARLGTTHDLGEAHDRRR